MTKQDLIFLGSSHCAQPKFFFFWHMAKKTRYMYLWCFLAENMVSWCLFLSTGNYLRSFAQIIRVGQSKPMKKTMSHSHTSFGLGIYHIYSYMKKQHCREIENERKYFQNGIDDLSL